MGAYFSNAITLIIG